MADNDAIVENLAIKKVLITKGPGGDVAANVTFQTDIMINAHTSMFVKSLNATLPSQLQTDIEHVWTDLEEWLKKTHFDLALE